MAQPRRLTGRSSGRKFQRFSLRLPQVGIAASGRQIRGCLRPQQPGPVGIRVKLPGRVASASLRTWVNERAVAHGLGGGFAVFSLPAGAGATDWAVTW